MDVRVRICREPPGVWSVSFPPGSRTTEFRDLTASLDFAMHKCRAAPALIELFSDGLYIGVPQQEGWPHQLCPPVRSGGSAAALSARLAAIGCGIRRIGWRLIPRRRPAGTVPRHTDAPPGPPRTAADLDQG